MVRRCFLLSATAYTSAKLELTVAATGQRYRHPRARSETDARGTAFGEMIIRSRHSQNAASMANCRCSSAPAPASNHQHRENQTRNRQRRDRIAAASARA